MQFFRRIPRLCIRSPHSSTVVCSRSECSRTSCSICSSCWTNHCSRTSTATATGYKDSVKHWATDCAATSDWIGNCATEYHEKNYAMIPYNILYYTVQLRHRVSFVNLPPDKRNSGCGYLSALFLRITTSINISLYLAIASILVRQIRPGGQQKARNDMIIVSYNGLKLKEDIVEDYCWNCRLIVNWKYASLGKIPNYIHY